MDGQIYDQSEEYYLPDEMGPEIECLIMELKRTFEHVPIPCVV
jgi:hypothetical protein